MVDSFGEIVDVIDYILSSKRRKHIVGGMLLSVSLLFGGLSFTAMTLKQENEEEQK